MPASEALHKNGINHCNVKPENVLITSGGHVKNLPSLVYARMMCGPVNPATPSVTHPPTCLPRYIRFPFPFALAALFGVRYITDWSPYDQIVQGHMYATAADSVEFECS